MRKIFFIFCCFFPLICFSDIKDKLKKGVIVYSSFEDSCDVYLVQKNLFLKSIFLRDSVAYTSEFKKFENNEPRILKGKFGNGLFLESGWYGNFSRGTENLLPLNSSKVDGFPSGFKILGNVEVEKLDKKSIVSEKEILLNCKDGGGIETEEINLPNIMRYIASVYLKGEIGDERISLLLEDLTNKVEIKKDIVLNKNWERYYIILPYDERQKKYEGKELKEPIKLKFKILSNGNNSFFFDALMVEQAGIFYSNRFFPSTWIEGGKKRNSEIFNIPILPETFNPREGSIAFWMKPEGEEVFRTLFSIGYGWDTPVFLSYVGNNLSFSFFGKRVSFKKEILNKWNFVVITWEKNKSFLYIDGEKIGEIGSEHGFDEEKIWGTHYRIMPGNSDSGYGFGSKTHINGIIDEFYIFDRSLSEEEINYIKDLKEPLIEIPEISVKYELPFRVFSRDQKEVPVKYVVTNRGKDKKKVNIDISVDELGFNQQYEFMIDVRESKEIKYDLPVEKLLSGKYRIMINTKYEDKNLKSVSEIEVGPYRKHSLPILAWNAGGKDFTQMEMMKKIGVNIVPAHIIINPETNDWAEKLGIYTFSHLNVRGEYREKCPEDRIVGVDGSIDGPDPTSEFVRESVKRQTEDYMKYAVNYPSLKYIIVNTEWQLPMNFREDFIEIVKEKFNIDLKKWMCKPKDAWWYVMPFNRLNPTVYKENWFPENGIVNINEDNFYKYHIWFYRNCDETTINEICLEIIKKERPDINTIIEPILRYVPIKRYKKNVDVAEEWFYYTSPRTAVVVQERLASISRGSNMKPSGMPQFLFKPGWVAPYAITPPPDMLKEVLWLCASRPLKMMTFWGWHRVLEKGKMLSHEEMMELIKDKNWEEAVKILKEKGQNTEGTGVYIPEVKDTFSEFANNILDKYGLLFQTWKNYPRKVVVVDSFVSWLYSNERWPSFRYLGEALVSSGIPFDVVFDEDFFENKNLLSNYQIVILPFTFALPSEAYNQIKEFSEKGGIVIADTFFKVQGIPNVKIFSEQEVENFKKFIKEKTDLPVKVETEDVIWNLLDCNGAKYLVIVNDKRDYGKYLGMWKKVKEKGIAQDVKIKVDKKFARYIFDLNEKKQIKTYTEKNFLTFNTFLGGCDGKIFLLLENNPGAFNVDISTKVIERGEIQNLKIYYPNKQGGILLKYEIITPSEKVFDVSGYSISNENGVVSVAFVIPVNAEKGKWKIKVNDFLSSEEKIYSFIVK